MHVYVIYSQQPTHTPIIVYFSSLYSRTWCTQHVDLGSCVAFFCCTVVAPTTRAAFVFTFSDIPLLSRTQSVIFARSIKIKNMKKIPTLALLYRINTKRIFKKAIQKHKTKLLSKTRRFFPPFLRTLSF